jgi:dephospho-CoA kinase
MPDFERSALILGITGGIACGKSEVGRILGEMGFAVCDADRVAHDLMRKGTLVYRRIVERFGTRILSDDGEISRPILGEAVFENPTKLETLNRLIHPAIREHLEGWLAGKRHQDKNAAILLPLLFESGMETLGFDAVVCVSSSERQVLHRLEKRGLQREEARARIRSQMPMEEKERRSDHVVLNIGTLAELEQSTRETVNRIKTGRGL